MERIKIFAPATVANISCGFDVLGLALDNAGDEMIFSKCAEPTLTITKIEGAELPFEPQQNVAGVVAIAMLEKAGFSFGVEIEIYKKIKPGSGIGSSAASAAGTAFGINYLLGNIFSQKEVVEFAMIGEKLVGGALVADNVAPAIMGGITLVKSYEPFEVFNLPVPQDLWVVVAHPQIELKTQDARRILQQKITMKQAIQQWANVGAFVHALHTGNYDLLGRSLQDVVVEPVRSLLIPLFEEAKATALQNGALGTGISGAGPSIFNFCEGETVAAKVQQSLSELYASAKLDAHVFASKVNMQGVKIID